MQIKKSVLIFWGMCIYTIGIIFAGYGVFFYACTGFFVLTQLLFFRSISKIRLDYFVVTYLLFIIYLIAMAATGNAFFPAVAFNRSFVMLMNLVINVLIMQQMEDRETRYRFLNVFSKIVVVFEIYVIIFSGSQLFSGRFGNFANTPIPYAMNANGIGLLMMIAMTFDLYYYLQDKKKSRMLRMILFLAGILLTGSRKAIVCSGIVLYLIPVCKVYFESQQKAIKIMRYTLFALLGCAVALVLLFKVPVLYDIAGFRVEAMLKGANEEGMYDEGSMNYRAQFVELAKIYFRQHPIVGIGIDNFAQVNFVKGFYAHNDYWEILTGSGIIGGTIYYSTYVYLAWNILKNIKKPEAVPLAIFLLLLVLINNQMVTYLERFCMLFMFMINSVIHDQGSQRATDP